MLAHVALIVNQEVIARVTIADSSKASRSKRTAANMNARYRSNSPIPRFFLELGFDLARLELLESTHFHNDEHNRNKNGQEV